MHVRGRRQVACIGVQDLRIKQVQSAEFGYFLEKGWQIFFMGFLAIFIVIGGLIALFVGVFISMMWISAAFAAIYHAVEMKDGIPEIRYNR